MFIDTFPILLSAKLFSDLPSKQDATFIILRLRRQCSPFDLKERMIFAQIYYGTRKAFGSFPWSSFSSLTPSKKNCHLTHQTPYLFFTRTQTQLLPIPLTRNTFNTIPLPPRVSDAYHHYHTYYNHPLLPSTHPQLPISIHGAQNQSQFPQPRPLPTRRWCVAGGDQEGVHNINPTSITSSRVGIGSWRRRRQPEWY